MKEPIDIYTKYNVDVNKLTRDYLKFPLQKVPRKKGGLQYEDLPKEDFVYLYIECNLPSKILQQYFNVCETYITKTGNLYNIKKSTNLIRKNIKQTNLQRYGVESYVQSEEFKEKSKQTCLKHFGVENYAQTNDFKNLFKDSEFIKQSKQKEYETKKKNGSFGKSKEENKIYNLLITKFKEVIRQYTSDLYPFRCDFYIPEMDLYIEYQGFWQHGFEPYLGTDEQNKIVESWEEKGTDQYSSAIKTWTVRDPQKRNTAKQNNLNWIEFFTMEEFMKWFETI